MTNIDRTFLLLMGMIVVGIAWEILGSLVSPIGVLFMYGIYIIWRELDGTDKTKK